MQKSPAGKCFMKRFDINDIEWTQTISSNKRNIKRNIPNEESWIFEANCFHLAAKFHPKSLHAILSNLKHKDLIITQTHQNGKASPMHVSSLRTDSLSTR